MSIYTYPQTIQARGIRRGDHIDGRTVHHKSEHNTANNGYMVLVTYTDGSTDVMGTGDMVTITGRHHNWEVRQTGGHGYPYRAHCVCGWQSNTYAAPHAADQMGAHHQQTMQKFYANNQ